MSSARAVRPPRKKQTRVAPTTGAVAGAIAHPVRAPSRPIRAPAWTAQEDALLLQAVAVHGPRMWSRIALNIAWRNSKQCRERWCNHLNTEIDKGPWTVAEDVVVHAGVCELGHKWSAIALRLPGRTDNQVKNRYNAFLQSKGVKAFHKEQLAPYPDPPAPKRNWLSRADDDATRLFELQRRNATTDAPRKRLRVEGSGAQQHKVQRVCKQGMPWTVEEEQRLATVVQVESERLKVGRAAGPAKKEHAAWKRIAQFVETRTETACQRHWGLHADACMLIKNLDAAVEATPVTPATPVEPTELTLEPFVFEELLAAFPECDPVETQLLCLEEYDEGADAPAVASKIFAASLRRKTGGTVRFSFRFAPLPPPPPHPRRKSGTKGPRAPPSAAAGCTQAGCEGTRSMKECYSETKRRAEAEAWERSVFA